MLAAMLLACPLCALLASCSIAASRGTDPRDATGPNGTVAAGTAPQGATLVAGPMLFDWLWSKLFPDKHEDVPPPPPPAVTGADPRANLEVDCTDPAKHPDKELHCK
jgi:hypothetical protein